MAVNGLPWAYNWYLQRWHWANVGTRAWWKNLRNGFGWDDDAFMDNQLAHPYHGSLYFNVARASRYGFWSSTGFTLAGSLTWELLTENVRPSVNDLINTTLGGIALGEVTFRISSPLIVKDAIAVNAPRPSFHRASVSLGQRAVLQSASAPPRTFVRLSFHQGSPFAAGRVRPYDVFEFSLELLPSDRSVIHRIAVSGLLVRHLLRSEVRNPISLGLYQHYEYEELPGFRASSQSLGGGLLVRHELGPSTELSLVFQLEALPLGAISSDHNGVRNRDYDYGIGGGGRFTGLLRHSGRDLFRLDGRTVWVHSLYGADADHVVTVARLSAMVPLLRGLGVGGDVGWTFRRSVYRDQARVLKRLSQLRAYLAWSP